MKQQHYSGLTAAEVELSRCNHGSNRLTPPRKEPLWKLFLQKFGDPIIRILLLALLLSFGIACFEFVKGEEGVRIFLEPTGILIAVLLATCISFWFEVKANRAFEVLNQVNDETPVQVIRDKHIMEVPKQDIVVGDIVLLNAGDEVPADGQLLEAVSLRMNESSLTGEQSARKSTDPAQADPEATYPTDQVMRGTTVTDGHGILRVMQVGDATEYGKVYTAAQIDDSIKTPLNEQLDGLGRVITYASYILAALILIGRTLIYFQSHDMEWLPFLSYTLNSFMIAVTLIVVAVPEGLPMSVTLSLALSMRRMLKSQNLVRKMHACETMGATTVICTDKTGTLTQNQMRVHETCLEDPDSPLTDEGIAVNSTAWLDMTGPQPTVLGNPTEGALLLWLQERGVRYEEIREACPVLEQLTFSTERKFMASVVRSAATGGDRILYLKGAPEILLSRCNTVQTPEGVAPLNTRREAIEASLTAYQQQAMRTLGLAYRFLSDGEEPFEGDALRTASLTYLGTVAISDPVRSDVPSSVQSCMDAGIQVKIVTGDTPGTAREIGRQIGLWLPTDTDENQITGSEFAALSDEELRTRVGKIKIMSRARPMDKQRLVSLLQQQGEVVAVTGDGTNDAPALKKAHVGLSMGDGTAVAKEASDITILDNSFASIRRAVLWGRSLYKNIQRFILFQMTVNVAACLIVLIGAFMGTESPLTVTQMLWVNLIMDTFAAMALASLPPSESVMHEKPRRRSDFIITPAIARAIGLTGTGFVLLLFGALEFMRHYDFPSLLALLQGGWQAHAPAELTRYELSLFFSLFVFLQLWNLFNAKAFDTRQSAFSQLLREPAFLGVLGIILTGQVLIVTFGGIMFNVQALSPADWLLLAATTSSVLWGREIIFFCSVRQARKRKTDRP